MKKFFLAWLTLVVAAGIYGYAITPFKDELKVIIIRHGEKPANGNNLSCQGLNRALQLPAVIQKKFGIPDYIYIPSVSDGTSTSHARMFQTATPLAVKYNLSINSQFDEKNAKDVSDDIKAKKGTVLVVWEHSAIPAIAKRLGIGNPGRWGNSFDTIWIITFPQGNARMVKDAEGITASDKCL
jgi:hypothetical protein